MAESSSGLLEQKVPVCLGWEGGWGLRAGKEGDEAETQQGACWEDLA